MANDAHKPQRRTVRLQGYDYSGRGAYFITIRVQEGACLFGEVVDCEMQLSDAGCMVAVEWQALPQRFPTIALDSFVVMPDHTHGIIVVHEADGGCATVGRVVGAFKSMTTARYVRGLQELGWPPFRGRLWQRNYYEHIVRSETSLNRIREYIERNPWEWSAGMPSDPEYVGEGKP